MPKSHGWRKTAVASLVIALLGLPASSAFALALGRITVQSALGEPLRAEIDIPEINADEAATLKPSLALPAAFRAAGLEYNPALAGVQISLQRRADGRAYIRLTSDRVVSEPFVDLILQATWASGRIVRDYTILLDPPALRARAPAAPTSPQVVATPVAPSRVIPAPAAAAAPAPAAPSASRTAASAPAATRPAQSRQVTVQRGDTASQIARANKPAQVSLDQMLVALLRANQNAFINGNLNLLKAGTVLNMPSEEQVNAVSESEASSTVIAQSKDFNEFRNKLASNAPTQKVEAADRAAGGAIKAQVEDKRSVAPTPDKLTLSKGNADAKAAEEKIAQAKAAEDAAKRAAELARNVKDLSSINAASAAAGTAAPLAAAPVASSAAAPVAIIAAAPVAAASAAAEPVATPAPVASAPVETPAPAPKALPVPAEPESGFLNQLLGNPLMLLGGGLLIALLAGLGIYKARQRRDAAEVDSAFLESRLQPDSFFGASGGQRVDTAEAAATGSSMVYSPSQLDAADDVDPVAEADVYLAYGRDMQAEEILKEALRTHPGRIAVHQKLLDIYAKRRDAQAFETMAKEAFRLAGADSAEWARICEQGQGIDPANPLYRPGSAPAAEGSPLATHPAGVMAATSMATQRIDRSAEMAEAQPSAAVDLDLDLDFSLDEEPASAIEEVRPSQLEPTIAMPPLDSQPASLDVDFGETTEALKIKPEHASVQLPVEIALPELDKSNDDTVALGSADSDDFRTQAAVSFGSTSPSPLSLTDEDPITATPADGTRSGGINFDATAPNKLTASQAPFNPPADSQSGMLEFDLGTLSLDLDATDATAEEATAEPEDPLATKLALAEEFVSIGDDDGARALIEEVIAEATGDLKTKAQRALASLG
ncbi:MAG TPA: FimV/HubP family polar landmark protein [Burkholderiaceae bacterium]|nr:FimV/HubP family polar landmark protein [Burkholderiaceae bacterium]